MNIPLFTARFAVMAITTFLAIIVWSKTRDAAWMLIVIGIIFAYIDTLYSLFIALGLAPDCSRCTGILRALPYILMATPWLFFSAAFIAVLRRYTSKR